MQFICETPLHVVVRSEKLALFDTRGNQVQTKQRRVFAKFQRGSLPPFAMDIARNTFEFRAKAPEQPLEGWASFYDSEADQLRMGWTDEERAAIEDRLQNALGVMRVERPRLAAPYGKYDLHRKVHGRRTVELAIKDIVAAYETAGFDVALAVAYERENGNDAAVIAALEGLCDTAAEPVEEVIAA